jgi:hypothetical protein
MPAMDDAARRRRDAWAGLVDEVVARPPTVGDVASVLRNHPLMVRRTREAGASAGAARQALVRVCRVLEERPGDPIQAQLLRAWADCLDDILALTERLCGVLADAPAAA